MKQKKDKKFRCRRDVYIPWEMIESRAFQELSATGIRVLIRFLQKRTWVKIRGKKKNIFNNSGLAITYAEARYMNISTSQFHVVLKKLIAVGFLDVEHQGGGIARDYSRYAISDRWVHYGTNDFRLVEKKRVLWPGHDVRSWTERKKLRKTVVVNYEKP